MPVRNIYNPRTVLEANSTKLNSLAPIATHSEDTKDKLDEVIGELEKTRQGHELHLWGEETEEVE